VGPQAIAAVLCDAGVLATAPWQEVAVPRTLVFGAVGLTWKIDAGHPHWAEFLAGYADYLQDRPGQLQVEAALQEVPPQAPRPSLPNSFIRYRLLRGADFDLGDGLIRGTLHGDSCRCTIHPVLLHGNGLRVLEQFFYLLYYQVALGYAPRLAEMPFLLHSSAVLQNGRGHLFCGPAGTGKSTVAALSAPRPILTDECTVVNLAPDIPQVSGTPINPFFREKRPGEAPLAALHLLTQADRHARQPLPRSLAVPRLSAEVIAPVGLMEEAAARSLGRALDCALALYRTGLVDELFFRRDVGFWDHLASPAQA
jgi:hypothetical protein